LATRRQFLKVGVAGAAVLLAVRALEEPLAAPAARHRVLDPASARIVAALAPVVLSGALPSGAARADAVREVVDGFDRAVAGLAPDVQDDISRLLGLLRFAPSRVALTGLWARLDEAPPHAVARFLSDWRASRFDLLRAGYQALVQLLNAAWYGSGSAWSAIGYPGPPALGQDAAT
jgi:hypothetical protein